MRPASEKVSGARNHKGGINKNQFFNKEAQTPGCMRDYNL